MSRGLETTALDQDITKLFQDEDDPPPMTLLSRDAVTSNLSQRSLQMVNSKLVKQLNAWLRNIL